MLHPSPPATLLVIDDDPDTRELYILLLEGEGYRVLTADTGQAALTKVRCAPIAAVVLDRRLPDGDGLEVCRHLRVQLGSMVPIVVVSVDSDPVCAMAAGATALIAKPFSVDQLLERLRTLIRDDTSSDGCAATPHG